MNTVTAKEFLILNAMKHASIECCGQFDEDQNLSYMNFKEVSNLFESEPIAKGVLGSLINKGLVEFEDRAWERKNYDKTAVDVYYVMDVEEIESIIIQHKLYN